LSKTAISTFPSSLPSVDFEISLGRYALKIWSGGFCRFDAYPTNHLHMHETYHELCLVIAGHGEFTHGGERFKVSPGWLFFSEKRAAHEISSYRSHDLHLVYLNLIITDSTAPLSSDPCDSVVHRFVLGHRQACGDGGGLYPYIELICNEGSTAFDRTRRQEAARLMVLDALDRLSTHKSVPASGGGAEGARDYVSRAIGFIERNLTRPIAVAEIAGASSCSKRHLRRLFVRETGKTIVEAVNERKINLAAQQLLMRFSVTQVATSLHISSVAHFSRLFKRYNGMSPKQYQITHAPKKVLPKTEFR
jgi:AraC-like DNA-binding protein